MAVTAAPIAGVPLPARRVHASRRAVEPAANLRQRLQQMESRSELISGEFAAEKLRSAYQDYNPLGETMAERHPKTIYGKIFEGTIDYILFNPIAL